MDNNYTINVLDHGFVKLLNISGPARRVVSDNTGDCAFDADDIDPANSARLSFGQHNSERSREENLKLVEYLIKNRHTTPLEMIQIYLEMKLPIFVARQFVRHRTVSINEISARYTKLPEEWYIPDPSIVGKKSKSNKQGRTIIQDNDIAIKIVALQFCDDLDKQCKSSYEQYLNYIQQGIPNELARCFLHVNHYTHWIWSQDLWNMMNFLRLRMHSHAQWEAQQYGNAIFNLIKLQLPNCMNLFEKYIKMD